MCEPCPCCNNPWHTKQDSLFALSCDECVSDDKGVTGIDPMNMDLKTSPGVNFFKHANGTWMANNPIPGEYPSWNTFTALHDKNLSRIRSLLDALVAPPKGTTAKTNEEKVAAFWTSAMDEEAVEEAGIGALAPAFAACDLATTDRTAAIAKLQAEFGVNAFFDVGAGPDDKDASMTLLQFGQGGLGLPDRDYYFDEDKKEKRELYVKHVANVLRLLGEPDEEALAGAKAVLKLETRLAASHLTMTERRDPETTYNKMSTSKLKALCKGGIDWDRFLQLVGKPDPKSLNVDSPTALAVAAQTVADASDMELRAYLRWLVGLSMSKHLGKAFVDEMFNFHSKELMGQQEQKPRWKRCLPMVEGAIGEAVGELYCKEYFAEEAKARALKLVESVRSALEARLKEVPWMAETTKATALEKMKGFGVKIGYPDKWVDYSSLQFVSGDHAGNVFKARAFEHKRQMGWADAPTDKSKWEMLPQQINAYYHPNLNEIVFPAAILQPPFYDPTADDAVNYGSFGAVVGHEMTHGFDDQGSQYNPSGNLQDWWAKADKDEYEKRVLVQVEQANQIEIHGKQLNGKLSCGENIADLGGLRLAYRAMKAAQQSEEAATHINGFTPVQRFFLAWAQLWRENISEAYALKKLTVDPHGPNEYRTNGPLSNMPEFHEAFGIKDGDPMFVATDKRVDIW